ncbi:MAG: S9 family peptidase [Chloroflexota bacterium]
MKILEQLFRAPYVNAETGFDISPKGKKIAFSWNISGTWEIYELLLGGIGQPKCITSGSGGKFSPKYSPGGRRLAFALDLNGSESYHIFLVDLIRQIQTDLTPEITFPLHPHFDWSPDGNEIAYLSIEPDGYGVYTLSIKEKTIRQICVFDQPLRDICWSPDGKILAIEEETAGSDSSIILVSLDGAEKNSIILEGKVINAKNPSWSPDGSELALSSDLRGFFDVGIYNISSGKINWLTSGKAEKTHPTWSPDGKKIAYIHSDGSIAKLNLLTLGEETPASYSMLAGVYYLPAFTPKGDQIVVTFENPRHPPDLWIFSLSDGKFNQLTDSMPETLREFKFVMPEEIRYPGLDGENIPALLYRPHKNLKDIEKNRPAIVNIHGGPDWLYQMIWNPFMSYLASNGWTVLAPNYRGSTGYGRDWKIASRYKMGQVDTEDIIAGAEYLIREKFSHPARIIVTGRSHGGYLTMMCLTKRSDLWAGGSAVVPFLNLFSSHEEARQDLKHWNIENFGDPLENHDRWVEGSPYFFLERIKAPVQLIASANDIRCPASDTIAAHKKLKEFSIQSELIVFPDEGHELLKIENIVESYKSQKRFFNRVLNES